MPTTLTSCVSYDSEECFRSSRTPLVCRNPDVSNGGINTLKISCIAPYGPECLYLRSEKSGNCSSRDDFAVIKSAPVDNLCSSVTDSYCTMTVDTNSINTKITVGCTRLQSSAVNCTGNMVHFMENITSNAQQKKCSTARFGITFDNKWMSGNCRQGLQVQIQHGDTVSTTEESTVSSSSSSSTLLHTSSDSILTSPLPVTDSNGNVAGIVVGSLLGCLLVVAIIAILLIWFKRRRNSSTQINRPSTDVASDNKSPAYEDLKSKSTKNKYNSLNESISNICLDNKIIDNSSMNNFYTNVEENAYINVDKNEYIEPENKVKQNTTEEQNVYLEIDDTRYMRENTPRSSVNRNDTGESDYILPDPKDRVKSSSDNPNETARSSVDDPLERVMTSTDNPDETAKSSSDDPLERVMSSTDDSNKKGMSSAHDPLEKLNSSADDLSERVRNSSDDNYLNPEGCVTTDNFDYYN